MTAEDWREWRRLPETNEVLKLLNEYTIETLQSVLVSSPDKTHVIAKMLGHVNGVGYVIDLINNLSEKEES